MTEPWPFLVAVLAAFGGSVALSIDTISDPLRDWLQEKGWTWVPDEPGGDITPDGGRSVEKPRAGGWRWLYSLISCPYCTGTWMALAATFVVMGTDVLTWVWWLVFWSIRGGHVLITSIFLKLKNGH